jgi:hypothetical protein
LTVGGICLVRAGGTGPIPVHEPKSRPGFSIGQADWRPSGLAAKRIGKPNARWHSAANGIARQCQTMGDFT